jgi:hypothetical protein
MKGRLEPNDAYVVNSPLCIASTMAHFFLDRCGKFGMLFFIGVISKEHYLLLGRLYDL